MPGGSDPPICDHVIDPAQQALSVLEYDNPGAAVRFASVTVSWTLYVPAAVGLPHTSTSPAEINDNVVPLPKRTAMPGGRPVAVQVNGAVPPLVTPRPRLHGTPIVQSSRPVLP